MKRSDLITNANGVYYLDSMPRAHKRLKYIGYDANNQLFMFDIVDQYATVNLTESDIHELKLVKR